MIFGSEANTYSKSKIYIPNMVNLESSVED